MSHTIPPLPLENIGIWDLGGFGLVNKSWKTCYFHSCHLVLVSVHKGYLWCPQSELATEKMSKYFSSPQTFTRCLTQHPPLPSLPPAPENMGIWDKGSFGFRYKRWTPPPPPNKHRNLGFRQFWTQEQKLTYLPGHSYTPSWKNMGIWNLCSFGFRYKSWYHPLQKKQDFGI